MLTKERIDKLRVMAERGTEHEKISAKSILEKAGIDWRKPKISFKDKIKKGLGYDITKTYNITIKLVTDIIILQHLLQIITDDHTRLVGLVDENRVSVNCTANELEDIMNLYNSHRQKYSKYISSISYQYLNSIT